MKIFNKIALTLVFTVLVIVAPFAAKSIFEGSVLESEYKTEFQENVSLLLNGKQFVQMLTGEYYIESLWLEQLDRQMAKSSSVEMLKSVFGENSNVYEHFSTLILTEKIDAKAELGLVMHNNNVSLLNTYHCNISSPAGELSLIFENKTKTLVTFSYQLASSQLDIYGQEEFLQELESKIDEYCLKRFGLNEKEYSFSYCYFESLGDGTPDLGIYYNIMRDGQWKAESDNLHL